MGLGASPAIVDRLGEERLDGLGARSGIAKARGDRLGKGLDRGRACRRIGGDRLRDGLCGFISKIVAQLRYILAWPSLDLLEGLLGGSGAKGVLARKRLPAHDCE